MAIETACVCLCVCALLALAAVDEEFKPIKDATYDFGLFFLFLFHSTEPFLALFYCRRFYSRKYLHLETNETVNYILQKICAFFSIFLFRQNVFFLYSLSRENRLLMCAV